MVYNLVTGKQQSPVKRNDVIYIALSTSTCVMERISKQEIIMGS